MKWFIILAVILGAYYFVVLSVSDTAINQTMQLHQQYIDAAAQVGQLTAANDSPNQ